MNNIGECEKYMLIKENIIPLLSIVNKLDIESNKEIKTKKIRNIRKIEEITTINSDPLFWIFYCILYGEQQFAFNYSFQTEKNFKIKSIEDLRKIKTDLKTFKLKLSDIEDELLNCKKISIKSLLALFLLYKKNMIYIWDRKFMEFICSEEENIYIIKNNKNEHHKL